MIYRLVYYSRNPESELGHNEIDAILRISQRNNEEAGVTGALMFDEGFFAQVLEGSQAAVEETFERIQMDPRHCDVQIVDFAPVLNRTFARWAMTYVGSNVTRSTSAVVDASSFNPRSFSGQELFQKVASLVFGGRSD
ncbi:BLUF domain-containing protein [Rhizobium sp. S163]|uniref:BLUF domain-containing protein n=1 Tax=Rhizobium sp. S163 TaxID=3055039 RepID=UPI0025AA13FD|nr:BLUF domain-containing protein [Rhizobium sp. S163]MDM9649121.1 BLUF domain-containing protein [Rhizobium sp. S163]